MFSNCWCAVHFVIASHKTNTYNPTFDFVKQLFSTFLLTQFINAKNGSTSIWCLLLFESNEFAEIFFTHCHDQDRSTWIELTTVIGKQQWCQRYFAGVDILFQQRIFLSVTELRQTHKNQIYKYNVHDISIPTWTSRSFTNPEYHKFLGELFTMQTYFTFKLHLACVPNRS